MAPTCPCCGAEDADPLYARTCSRSGVQVNNDYQPIVHVLLRTLKQIHTYI